MFLSHFALLNALVPQQQLLLLPSSCKNRNAISLTFDGSLNKNINFHLEKLNKKNIKATFFITPLYNEEEKELIRLIYNEGHQIGLFLSEKSTYTTRKTINAAFNKASSWIHSIIRVWPTFVRIPEQYRNELVVAELQMLHYVHVPVTLDFFNSECGQKIQFDPDKFVRKRNEAKAPPWDIIRFSICKDDFYQFANQKLLSEIVTPDYCLDVKPYQTNPFGNDYCNKTHLHDQFRIPQH